MKNATRLVCLLAACLLFSCASKQDYNKAQIQLQAQKEHIQAQQDAASRADSELKRTTKKK